MVLATIVTSLGNYLGLGKGSGDEDMLDVMGSGDVAENDKDDEEAAAVAAPETSSSGTATPTQTGLPVRKFKKNVAEDWDADEDKLSAQDKIDAQVEGDNNANDAEEYKSLMNVYRGFARLKNEFDAKFREIFA